MEPHEVYQDNASDPTNHEVPAQYRCALRRGNFLTLVNEYGQYIQCATIKGVERAKNSRSFAWKCAAGGELVPHYTIMGVHTPEAMIRKHDYDVRVSLRKARGWADDTSDTSANFCTGAKPWNPSRLDCRPPKCREGCACDETACVCGVSCIFRFWVK